MQRRKAACLLGLIAVASAAVAAENWPKWRGPRGDNIVKDENLLQSWPKEGLREVWRVKVGKGFSNPVAVDDVIYMFSQEDKTDVLVALAATDRRQLWRKSYPTRYRDRNYPGTRATPTIEGDRIYTMGGGGDLACWNKANGDILWRINVLAKTHSKPINWGNASSPLVIGDRIYVQAGKGGATAVAVNKADGEIQWQSESTGDAGYSTIAPAEVDGRKMLLVFGGVELIAMDPQTGKTLWTFPYETQYRVNAMTPIVRDGKAFITHGYKFGKCALLKLGPRSVEKVWDNKVIAARFRTPILEGDVMYANSNPKGVLKCVKWATGEEVWACDDRSLNLGYGGSLIRSGDLLVVFSDTGKLSLVHATPEGWRLRGQMRLFSEKHTWSTPLIHNGRLYVKGGDDLVCLDVSAVTAAE